MSENSSSEPFVLGQQYADALSQEQARLKARPPPTSPLPAGEYESRPGEFELLNPAPSGLDGLIRKSCKSFACLPAGERARFTTAISMDEFYKLIAFARRVSVFALRTKDAAFVRDGLTALAMIEVKRTDFRDVVWVLALLHHAAARLGLDADSMIRSAAQLRLSQTKRPKDYSMLGVMLGVADDRVFCLIIARSFVQGTAAFETGDSLSRFRQGIQQAISKG